MVTALLVHRLGKSYEAGLDDCRVKVVALRDVDLDLSFGELAAVVGPPGAGKTTLLRCVGGLLEPTWGSVFRSAPAVLPTRTVQLSATLETATAPAILVCDDVFDDRPIPELEQFFQRARDRGHAVLTSARSAHEPLRYGARIIAIHGGRIVQTLDRQGISQPRARIAEGPNRRRAY